MHWWGWSEEEGQRVISSRLPVECGARGLYVTTLSSPPKQKLIEPHRCPLIVVLKINQWFSYKYSYWLYNISLYKYTISFSYSRHLNCLQFLATVNNVMINIFVHKSFLNFWGCSSGDPKNWNDCIKPYEHLNACLYCIKWKCYTKYNSEETDRRTYFDIYPSALLLLKCLFDIEEFLKIYI